MSDRDYIPEIDAVIAARGGHAVVAERTAKILPEPLFNSPEPITSEEWATSRPTPDCIVQDYLYADVAVFIAPGGMGKTTLKLYEAIHIALGRNLYGLKVRKPGCVVIITGEDDRGILVSRLRLIADAMYLNESEIEIVMDQVRICDVSGIGFKLTEMSFGSIKQSDSVVQVIDTLKALNPVLVVIDPAVSFGVGESRINDAEQALIEVARRLKKALNCCVQYVHHTGKANAREKTVDQYSGRGGSAFADGSRMVHVLQSMTPKEWLDETATKLLPGETGLRLARPKMSYCSPTADILIRRDGYFFEPVRSFSLTSTEKANSAANQIWQFLTAQLASGMYHSKNTLESQVDAVNLSRTQIRAAVDQLIAAQRIEARPLPNAGKNGRREYLHPVASPTQNGEPTQKSTLND